MGTTLWQQMLEMGEGDDPYDLKTDSEPFGPPRMCGKEGCRTRLSRSNQSAYCRVHDGEVKLAKLRERDARRVRLQAYMMKMKRRKERERGERGPT